MTCDPSVPRSVLALSLGLGLAALVATPAFAESLTTSASSAGSSASSAGSASSRGSSDSIRSSSNSSGEDRKVAEGEYRVATITPASGRNAQVTLHLVPAAGNIDGRGFQLDLPPTALSATGPVGPGDLIMARHRSYGLEFARTGLPEPFFLVVADAWQADLQTRVVRR